jgi:hypothetical protein
VLPSPKARIFRKHCILPGSRANNATTRAQIVLSGNMLLLLISNLILVEFFTITNPVTQTLYKEILLSLCLIHKFSNPAIVALNPASTNDTWNYLGQPSKQDQTTIASGRHLS